MDEPEGRGFPGARVPRQKDEGALRYMELHSFQSGPGPRVFLGNVEEFYHGFFGEEMRVTPDISKL